MVEHFEQLTMSQSAEEREKLVHRIEELEHDNDEITHQIFHTLGKHFITPFVREDIHYLGSSLDDVADKVWEAAKTIELLDVDPTHSHLKYLGLLLKQSVSGIETTLNLFNHRFLPEQVFVSIEQVYINEQKAQKSYDQAILELFETASDFKTLLKTRNVFSILEEAMNTTKTVARVLETMILKSKT